MGLSGTERWSRMYEKAARMTAMLELARCLGYCSYMLTENAGVWFVLSKLSFIREDSSLGFMRRGTPASRGLISTSSTLFISLHIPSFVSPREK